MIKKVLIPSDLILFKQELLKTKQAKRILLYKDGSAKVEIWNANNFTPNSDLIGNILSQLGHRKDKDGIIEAIYEVCNADELDGFEVEEMASEAKIYISYKKGWSSFRPTGEYVSGYIVENNTITIFKDDGFAPGKTVTKYISSNDMRELLDVFEEAFQRGLFEKSNTTINTIHGAICTYDYEYRSKSGTSCGMIFTEDNLISRYKNVIDRIIK